MGAMIVSLLLRSLHYGSDDRIPQLLETHSQMIEEDKLSDRYKIQLYSGNVTTASRTLKRYRTSLGTWKAHIKHETPNYTKL